MSNAVFTRVLEIDELASTSMEAKRLCAEVSGQNLAVWTRKQTQGRGQVGATWYTGAKKDIAFSLIFYPGSLLVQQQFLLNMVVCNALCAYVKSVITDKEVHVKWPNDILIGNKKVCGVLIENIVRGQVINHSVIGVGLNVNTIQFPSALHQATSLMLEQALFKGTQRSETLNVIERVGEALSVFYEVLPNAKAIEEDYLSNLFGMMEERTYIKDGQSFKATITGVDDSGKLKMLVQGNEELFGFKEISFVY